jgi:hypothetical protein
MSVGPFPACSYQLSILLLKQGIQMGEEKGEKGKAKINNN